MIDLSKLGVAVVRSPMGGCWTFGVTDSGTDLLERFFDEPPYPLIALDGQPQGYIVEPYDCEALAEYLSDCVRTVE